MFTKKTSLKFITYITALFYVLTLMPVVSFAAEDTATPVIYDAYISGNFVTGETLTANYSFDDSKVDTEKTNATIKWYAESNRGNCTQINAAAGSTTWTAEVLKDGGYLRSIFFTVTPTNSAGEQIGKTEYSNFGCPVSTKDTSASTTPEVRNATIVPLNADGTTMVGDTLAARFSYREVSGVAAGTHQYQWYTGKTMSIDNATAIENATASTYTVQPNDSGKWIFVKITPVANNQAQTKGTSVTTKNHLGNVARLGTASISQSSGFVSNGYSKLKYLADSSSPVDHNNKGCGFIQYTSTGAKTLVIDAGKLVPFNGYYVKYGQTYNQAVTGASVRYSTDGVSWSDDSNSYIIDDVAKGYSVDKEFSYADKVRYARYFKLEFSSATATSAVVDFYPFITNKALPKITLVGDDEVSLLAAPDAEEYEDNGYVLINIPDGYTETQIRENYIATEIFDADGNATAGVDTTTKGEYTFSYTMELPGLDKQSVSRKIVIGNGQKTPGNLAYYYEDDKNEVTYINMADKNSIEGAPTINDGNRNTYCEIESSSDALLLPASAVIEVNDTESDETYVSRFVIDENGDNITGYNIYVSSDGSDWGESVYSGTSIGENCEIILPTPVCANFVKLEIVSADDAVKIREVEVHLDDDSKISMAKDIILGEFEKSVKALNHRDGYIYKNLPLVTSAIYGTKAKWTVEDASADIAYADNVNGELKIARQDEETDFILKLMVEFVDESKAGIYAEEELPTLTIAKKSVPRAIDVQIKGNFVMGQTLTIPDGYYYDEAGVPEDKDATQIKWYRSNKWGSTDKNQGYLSANLPSTERTYTIAPEDVYDTSAAKLFYNIYASITPASMADDDAKTGATAFTPLYEMPTTVSGDDAPTVSSQYISTLSKEGTMLAGDKLTVHYSYINRGEVAEGATSYRWQTRASLDSNPEILTSDSPLNKTYTLTEADFGKWIECVITPVSKSGKKGAAVIARNYYGNAFLSDNAASYGTSGFRGKPSLDAIKVMAYQENGYLYGSGSGADKGVYSDAVTGETLESFTYFGGDAGRAVPFSAFYVGIGSVAFNDLEFYYKLNEDDEYTKLETTASSNDLAANGYALYEFEGGARLGRYFRVKAVTASGYSMLYGFFPCLTMSGVASIEFSDDLRVVKGDSTFSADTAFISAKDAVGSVVTPVVSGSVNVNKTGNYDVTYTIATPGDVWFPEYSVTKTFTVVDGIAAEGDAAFGADASVSNGSGASNLTDGNENTVWQGEGTSADIIIDLGLVKPISAVKLNEVTSCITDIKLYTSSNATDWILQEVTVNSDGQLITDPTTAKYVKLSLTYTSAPTVSGIEVSADKEAKAKLAIDAISVPETAKSDIVLASKGLYDTTISWLTTNPDVITDDGTVVRQDNDTVVTLTARVMDGENVLCTKSFHVTVVKKESSAGGGGSSGGSSGGSMGGGFAVSGPAPAPIPVLPSQTAPNYKNFPDVPNAHWAADFVNSLYENGIISGRGNGSFEPDAQITRAEFLKLIVEGLKLTSDNAKADFADVSENDWYYKYVAIASELGIVKGADGRFNPNELILRRDMAVLAKRALDAAGISLEKTVEITLADMDSVAEYAKDAVTYLSGAGIINGNEKSEFMPDNNATRAESAKIIYMLIEKIK